MSAKEIELDIMKKFLLIKEVEKSPELWKGNDVLARKEKWKQISIKLYGDETKAESLKRKWNNIRTSYIKDRKKPPRADKHNYIWGWALGFLEEVSNENRSNEDNQNEIRNFFDGVAGIAVTLPVESQNRIRAELLDAIQREASSVSRNIPSIVANNHHCSSESIPSESQDQPHLNESANSLDSNDSMLQEQVEYLSTVSENSIFYFETSGAQASNLVQSTDGQRDTIFYSIPVVPLLNVGNSLDSNYSMQQEQVEYLATVSGNSNFHIDNSGAQATALNAIPDENNPGIITELPLNECELMDFKLFGDIEHLSSMDLDNSDLENK